MIFQSLEYVAFLLAVLAAYWLLGRRMQNLLLIAAGLLFYGRYHPWFLLPFAATTVIDYFVARAMPPRTARGRVLVAVSVTCNLLLLCAFKYLGFLTANIGAVLGAMHLRVPLPVLQVVLPAGISFYTFQSIGYVVDVYRGHVPACRDFRDYALFVSFFPQLVAGPIQRARDLLGQIRLPRSLTPEHAAAACSLLLWGFFQKLVIADNVALIANKVFSLESPSFPLLWSGVLAFAVQIFADFSGYTDIARGSAALFGIELTRNFNHPYLADAPAEFWKRWHMSLSQWIRDYLYIPLGGSRVSPAREVFNLVTTFFLIGLWHGASWNFALWGLYHAALTLLYRGAARVLPRSWQNFPGAKPLRIALMFVLTCLGWLIFRETSLPRLFQDLTLSPLHLPPIDWRIAAYLAVLSLLYAIPLMLHALWDLQLRPALPSSSRAQYVLRALTALLLFSAILVLRSDSPSDFIYFQF